MTVAKRTIMSKIAIDTNILLYSIDEFDLVKQHRAIELIAETPHISSQLVSEFANVCLRKWRFPKEKVAALVTTFLNKCEFIPITRQITLHATKIMHKYQLQFFDAIIITAAMDEGCKILYSEDMHHDLLVEKSLRIINPFI